MMRDLWDNVQDLAGKLGDGYWRADHQLELAIAATIACGLVAFAFKYAELRMEGAMKGPNA